MHSLFSLEALIIYLIACLGWQRLTTIRLHSAGSHIRMDVHIRQWYIKLRNTWYGNITLGHIWHGDDRLIHVSHGQIVLIGIWQRSSGFYHARTTKLLYMVTETTLLCEGFAT